MLHSSPTRRLQALPIARSSRVLLACAVTAGLSMQMAIHPSQAEEAVTAEAYLASLVNDVTDSQNAVANLELEMGGFREGANKARVDLDKARASAQEAQDGVENARGRLGESDVAVTDAQKELDEIARSAYTTGGDASPVTLAAGGDAVANTLDRASFIRSATEQQQKTVNRLDLARTQTANEESALRDNRNDANSKVNEAIRLHNEARTALADAQKQVQEKNAQLQALIKDRDLAQKRLDAARSAVDTLANTKPDATSFDKRRAAEAAADNAESKAPAAAKDEEPASAPADTTDSAADTQQDSAEQNKTEQNNNTAAPQQSPAAPAGPASPAGAVEQYSGDTGLRELPTGADFAGSAEGDEQRQLAINGLLAAGGAAAMAGFNSYSANGDQGSAVNAALAAGREAAGEQYDQAQSTLNPPKTTTPGTPSTTTPTTPTTPSTPGTPSTTTPTTPTVPTIPTTPGTPGTGSLPGNTSGTASERIEKVIARGMSQLGVTYAWGGGNKYGPTLGIRDGGVADGYGDYAKIGFDCSGLTLYAFAAAGITLDHYSGSQYTAGRQVPTSQIKRGDMLFWGAGGSQHVAIYLGDGQMLEAPQSGSTVRVSDVRYGGMTPMAVRLIE